jgi:hypothetical protein
MLNFIGRTVGNVVVIALALVGLRHIAIKIATWHHAYHEPRSTAVRTI